MIRAVLLRLALGDRTFQYLVRTIKYDPRTPTARTVDMIVRKDGTERRIEADWIKKIAQIIKHVTPKPL